MSVLNEETSVVKIVRGNRNSIEKEFNAIADTDFPLIILEAGMPQINPKYSSRLQGVIEGSVSVLNVDLYCYIRCNGENLVKEDDQINLLLNDVWAAICNNANIGDAIKCRPTISPTLTYAGNYCYFTFSLAFEYFHNDKTI